LNPRYPLRYVRFRGGSFQPLTHLSASDNAVCQLSVVGNNRWLPAISKERLQHFCAASCQYPRPNLNLMIQLRVIQHLHH
jgi:hypothetical protein